MTAAIKVYPILSSDRKIVRAPARRLRLVDSTARVEGGSALPVYYVSDADITAGLYTVDGGAPLNAYVAVDPVAHVIDGAAIPVYGEAGTLLSGAAASSLLTSLVAYWKLDELSGTRVDATGRGNDLTDNNTVTQATGKVGSAGQFAAANSESLSHVDNADLSIDPSDTVAAWVYLDTKTANRTIVAKANHPSTREFVLYYDFGANRFIVDVVFGDASNPVAVANSFGSPSTGVWYFVTGWLDSVLATANIQINNGAIDSVATTGSPVDGNGTFALGEWQNLGRYMDGRIDEVGLWKRVLTAAERTALYNGGAGRTHPFVGT